MYGTLILSISLSRSRQQFECEPGNAGISLSLVSRPVGHPFVNSPIRPFDDEKKQPWMSPIGRNSMGLNAIVVEHVSWTLDAWCGEGRRKAQGIH